MGKRTRRRPLLVLTGLLWCSLIVCGGFYASATVWPSAGAQGADILRGVIGDPAVAWLEGAVFQVQDSFLQLEYRLGAEPAAPWAVGSAAATPHAASTVRATPSRLPSPTVRIVPEKTDATAAPSPTATPIRWPPRRITAFGTLEGEGEWIPYFSNVQGEPVAYRTFLQPDAGRPYTVAAIVAVDLDKLRLQYVLGFEEPFFKEEVEVERTGIIPREDRQPGILLAAFNGGFLTRHGIFGVMVDGKVLVPMVHGLGTLMIHPDGRVRIGVWGSDLTSLEGISTVRQNGAIVVRDGRINPQAFEDSLELWGASLSGNMTTWRSAIGISADGRTFYYVAGWSLNMPALARALQTAGAYNAMEMDINQYWVLFTAISFFSSGPKAIPLLDEMSENVDRYLYASSRDYFYLAAKSP